MAIRRTLPPWKPSRAEQVSALRRRVPDLIREDLDVLFCGINPGLYSAAVGHHFAGPGNLFWGVLHAAGFTPREFTAFEEAELLALGYGITNLVPRASAAADDVTRAELEAGARTVMRKVKKFRPRVLAVCGLVAYRHGFKRPKAQVGLQREKLGETRVWLLPNPSGLNAFHQPPVMRALFATFREGLEALCNGTMDEATYLAKVEEKPRKSSKLKR
jgi:double-stranded uracil-DNA glycosylase